MTEIARDVAVVPMIIANAYLVGDAASWVLVDAGVPGNAGTIRRAAVRRFGSGARPRAIVLTHGHFDHAGSAGALADYWGVPIYARALELPYLTARSPYPPLDPTPPGFFCGLSRLFPSGTVNLAGRVCPLPGDCMPGVPEWECLATPGHTPGHTAFFRRSDRVLLAGDALTTMDLDTFRGTLMRQPRVCRPPLPATTDWVQARRTVDMLAALAPDVIAAGHGVPMHGAAGELRQLAAAFVPPPHGRYVKEPVRAGEEGVIWLPPTPPDPVPAIATGVAVGVAAAGLGWYLARKPRRLS